MSWIERITVRRSCAPTYEMNQIAYRKRPLTFALVTTGFTPLWIKQKSAYNKVWGKIIVDRNIKGKVALDTPALVGLGSLLVTVAKKT